MSKSENIAVGTQKTNKQKTQHTRAGDEKPTTFPQDSPALLQVMGGNKGYVEI